MEQHSYVARQAILDTNLQVQGYELLYRDGVSNAFPHIDPDSATIQLITDHYFGGDLDAITDGKKAFINFHEQALMNGLPATLDPRLVVIEILETVTPTKAMLDVCRQLHQKGFTLVLDDHDFDPRWHPFFEYIAMVKIDISEHDYDTIVHHLPTFKKAGIKLLAERIESQTDLERFKTLEFDYFQGFFFAKPQVMQRRKLLMSKLSLMELTAEANAPTMDVAKVSALMETDVALSYRLLRFINNPLLYKRQPISSLRHAMNYMGQSELKKFISMMVLASVRSDKPSELMLMALVRAKFCELVSKARGDMDNPPVGFLLGMFSTLDALLDQSMQEVVARLPLLDEVKQGLCGNGPLADYLCLVSAYERANWPRLSILTEKLALNEVDVAAFYFDAVEWGGAMHRTLES